MAITCRSFQHLHDAYLDRELSESQTAEVHAHLLQCPECQRQVEIVRACGDVIAMDPRGPRARMDFADRVLATLPSRRHAVLAQRRAWPRVKRWLEYGVAPAIAATLTFAVIIGPPARVAGPIASGNGDERLVAGTSARFTDPIAPTVDGAMTSIDQVGRAVDGLKDFCERSLNDAPKNLTPPVAHSPAASEATFVNQLLQPFFDLFDPPIPARPAAEDVERF